MGTFNYFVDIDKDVDIDVNISVDVDKFVQSFTNIDGYLAVAEAAADAFATEGGTNGRECEQFTFLIDDFTQDQNLVVNGLNSSQDTLDPFTTNTDVPNAVRTLTQENLEGVAVDGTVRVNALPGKASFGNEPEMVSLQGVNITGDPPFDILQCEDPGEIDFFDVTDDNGEITNSLILEGVNFQGEEGTLRLELELTDSDGTSVAVTAYAVSPILAATNDDLNGFVSGQDIYVPLAAFLIPGGTDLSNRGLELDTLPLFDQHADTNQGIYSAGIIQTDAGADGVLNLEQVVEFDFRLLGDNVSGTFIGPFATDQVVNGENGLGNVGEVPGLPDVDVFFGQLTVATECCTDDGGGTGALSETETFAQVDQVTGFTEAFSMSLAATNSVDSGTDNGTTIDLEMFG